MLITDLFNIINKNNNLYEEILKNFFSENEEKDIREIITQENNLSIVFEAENKELVYKI